MKVSELKSELSKRGQPVFGLKAVLLERLRSALQQRLPNLSSADQVARATDDLTGFSATARWRALVPNEAAVEEPQNNTSLRAPTIPADDAEFIPQKHNFSETFDPELFLGKEKIPKRHKNGHLVLEDGKLVWDEKVNIKGGPKMEFLEEHKLDVNSLPQEWFNAFLPIYNGKISNPHHGNTPYWTHKWANYTNKKALMLGAGVPGGIYPTFKPFSYQEIERFIAIYILQGLNPSPQVEMKFNSQETDPVQGNDLCYRVFGCDAVRRHKQFKAFFCVQDPMKVAPSRKERPTYKVDPFLIHVQERSMRAWRMGRDISGDEQTLGFQGRHADKLRITYKAEGDGFQCDALCDSGYTWTFFFRNMPAPKKWIRLGFSPLHSRILGMFDQLEDKNHNCWFDNLYLSAKFAKASFSHKKQVRISGPTRKSGRGLPKCVLQEEKTSPSDIRAVRGTVKAAVLEGDPKIPNLVAVSYYDQKPVHFLSTICESIKWIQCEKPVFCVETEQVEKMKFLRLNINDDYNHDMGGCDIADQLRNYYRFDHWMRKRKWWWSFFFWATGVLLVNTYISYKTYMTSKGMQPMTHYEFRKAIALAWLDPSKHWHNRLKNRNKSGASSTTTSGNTTTDTATSSITSRSLPSRRKSSEFLVNNGTKDPTPRKKPRCAPLNDAALCTRAGAYKHRLSVSQGAHLPMTPTANDPRCSLHSWAKNMKIRKQIVKCETCGIHLCVECYKNFHTIQDVHTLRCSVGTTAERNINKPIESNMLTAV